MVFSEVLVWKSIVIGWRTASSPLRVKQGTGKGLDSEVSRSLLSRDRRTHDWETDLLRLSRHDAADSADEADAG